MKILVLITISALLTGCAATESSAPIASTSQTQSVEAEVKVNSDPESTPMETEPSSITTDEATEAKASEEVTNAQSAQPSASKSKEPAQTEPPKPVASKTASPKPTPEPTPEPTEPKYTMAVIAKNNTSTSCWVAISGKAYDLTNWISKHPGGSGAISSICGTDATSAFQGKHGGQSGPASALTPYLLGDVNG